MKPIPRVAAVHLSSRHGFVKMTQPRILLLEEMGVEGDAHCGRTIQHVYGKRRHAERPNLRQVHLVQIELIESLRAAGGEIEPGNLGENISTRALDMRALRTGARLHIGSDAIVEVTGLRAPCVQIDRFRAGLRSRVTERQADGSFALMSAVMAVVVRGGVVYPDDRIVVEQSGAGDNPLAVV